MNKHLVAVLFYTCITGRAESVMQNIYDKRLMTEKISMAKLSGNFSMLLLSLLESGYGN